MAARLASVLPRLAVLTVIWLLATSTITFAAAGRPPVEPPPPAPPVPKEPATLVVPDVRRQAYVFAKGILDDAGFAWRVAGSVEGYAANSVASQSPAPGTRVLDNGAPTIVLRLARNENYEERGLPESASPHKGSKVVLASELEQEPPAPAAENAPKEEAAKEEPTGDAPADGAKKDDVEAGDRTPDFVVPNAPPEPKDEMPLPDRARLLERRIAAHAQPSRSLVNFWLYQHAWVVTGARFGWHDGAEALRILIRVDEDVQARWGVGAKSEAIARATLAAVEAKAGK